MTSWWVKRRSDIAFEGRVWGRPTNKAKLKWVEWSLDCRCGASKESGPAKKEGGWIAPRFRLKDHETLLVYAGLVLGLSTHIF